MDFEVPKRRWDDNGSPHHAIYGLGFIVAGASLFLGFFFAAIVSKLLPPFQDPILSAIQDDRYYCLLVPLTLPILVVAIYFHWLSMKLFKHAWIIIWALHLPRVQAKTVKQIRDVAADTPPRGWNSYDSFAWVIREEEFMQNANILSQRLLEFGYEYVVVDYLWYRRLTDGVSRDSYGHDVIDQWGRVMPDPGRWPSSVGGNGFKKVSEQVHNMGLKFGIHVMRGISIQAVDNNTPILDVSKGATYEEAQRQWGARDIGIRERTCAWMSHGFMSVNTDLGAGRAFLRSLYTQYAEWGVDFVKLDCVFGDDLDQKEIVTVSELLQGLARPVILSLSPGTHVTTDMANLVSKHANMYRITGDDWDTWPDIESHFGIARDVAASRLTGSEGLSGRSWPDLDMLPLGWLTNSYGNVGPYRNCSLTPDEQKTQMTLWSMAKSPLFFGGDLRHMDEFTFYLISNRVLLEINSFSENNMEFPSITINQETKSQNIHSFRQGKILNSVYRDRVRLVSCKNQLAKSWRIRNSLEGPVHIYWESTREDTISAAFHVDKSRQLQQLNTAFEGRQVHLSSLANKDLCLDAFVGRRFTLPELNSRYFSPCEWKSSQIWELSDDGSIRSNYSGLCMVMERKKNNANGGGGRSWVATGRNGEVYLSFFNLNAGSATISTTIGDIANFLPTGSLKKGSCKCHEVWSGNDFGVISSTLSFQVPGHGCSLFILDCN